MTDLGSNAPRLSNTDLNKDLILKQYDLLLAAPEDWRRRASSAASLLTAGAAALLAGLLLGPSREIDSLAQQVAVAAAAFYLSAVLAFMYAATKGPVLPIYNLETGKMEKRKWRWPFSSSKVEQSADVPQHLIHTVIQESVALEVVPLKRAVTTGAISASLALILTIASVATALNAPPPKAFIKLLMVSDQAKVRAQCPGFSEKARVTLESTSDSAISFTVPAHLCNAKATRLWIPTSNLLVVPAK